MAILEVWEEKRDRCERHAESPVFVGRRLSPNIAAIPFVAPTGPQKFSLKGFWFGHSTGNLLRDEMGDEDRRLCLKGGHKYVIIAVTFGVLATKPYFSWQLT